MTGGGGESEGVEEVVRKDINGEVENRKRHALGDFLRSAFADVPEPERYDPTWYSNELRGEFGHLGSRQLSGPVLPRAYHLTTADLDLLDDTDADTEDDHDDGSSTITSSKLMSPLLTAAAAAAAAADALQHTQLQPRGDLSTLSTTQVTGATGRNTSDTRIKPIQLNIIAKKGGDEKENPVKKQETNDNAAVKRSSPLTSPVTAELATESEARDEGEGKCERTKNDSDVRQSRGLRISFRRSRKLASQVSCPNSNTSTSDSRISRLFRHAKKPVQPDQDTDKQASSGKRRRSLLLPKRTVNQ